MKAFPAGLEQFDDSVGRYTYQGGMDLRDYFAAAALTGLVISQTEVTSEDAARLAYQVADVMMKERQNEI